jgi:hypothetical protein
MDNSTEKHAAQPFKEDSQDGAIDDYARSATTEKHSVEADIGDCPDGGLRAWLVVLGVSAYSSRLMSRIQLFDTQGFLAVAST